MCGETRAKFQKQSGQATTEYILLLAVVVSIFLIFLKELANVNLQDSLNKAVSDRFARTYRYGHPKVIGFEEADGPKYHPRAEIPDGQNFRIFISPRKR